jgi:hypothetical protein
MVLSVTPATIGEGGVWFGAEQRLAQGRQKTHTEHHRGRALQHKHLQLK